MVLFLAFGCTPPQDLGTPEDLDGDGVRFPEDCDDDDPFVQTCPSPEWVDLSAGGYHTCAIHGDGTLGCWGDPGENDSGQADPAPGQFREIATQQFVTCGVTDTFAIDCWGTALYEYGAGEPTGPITGIDVGFDHVCALGPEGVPVCWGGCYYHQCDTDGEAYEQIDAGYYATCAVPVGGGDVRCWGDYFVDAPPPRGDFRQVSVGVDMACAVDVDGALACWGRDVEGVITVPEGGGFTAVSVGYGTACALAADGTVVCWGESWAGQADAPEGRFVRISMGFEHGCVLAADGSIACWGYDEFGQTAVP